MSTTTRFVSAAVFIASCLSLAGSSRAAFHLWDITEIFTNEDGSVQFIELFSTSAGQGFLSGHRITATSDGVPVTFTFNHNLTGASTANKHFLLATAGFGALAGGVAPDYTPLPAGFLNPTAETISINFADFDTVTFAGALLPTDGVHSLTDQSPSGAQNLVAGVNSPTNFPGASGSIDLSAPEPLAGDYNGNGRVEQADLDLVLLNWGTALAQPWVDGTVDQAELDGVLLNWGNEAALGHTNAVPEPASAGLAAILAVAILFRLVGRANLG